MQDFFNKVNKKFICNDRNWLDWLESQYTSDEIAEREQAEFDEWLAMCEHDLPDNEHDLPF